MGNDILRNHSLYIHVDVHTQDHARPLSPLCLLDWTLPERSNVEEQKHLSKSIISGVNTLLEGRKNMWAVGEWNKTATKVWVLLVWEKCLLQAIAPGFRSLDAGGILGEDAIPQVSRSLAPLRLCLTLLSTPRETTLEHSSGTVSGRIANPRNYKNRCQTLPQSNIILIIGMKNKQWLSGSSSIPSIEGYTSATFLILSIYSQKLTLIKRKKVNVIKFSKKCRTLSCYDNIACQGCSNYNFIWHWQHTILSSGAVGSQLLPCLLPKPPS